MLSHLVSLSPSSLPPPSPPFNTGTASDSFIYKVLGGCFLKNKPLPPKDEIQPSILYCVNRDVDRENAERLK